MTSIAAHKQLGQLSTSGSVESSDALFYRYCGVQTVVIAVGKDCSHGARPQAAVTEAREYGATKCRNAALRSAGMRKREVPR